MSDTTVDLAAVTKLRKALLSNNFPVVPVKTRQKAPAGFAWQTSARKMELPTPSMAALNTGILCDGLRVIDIDIDDPNIADEVSRLATELMGVAPARVRSNSGRQTLVYKAETGEPKKRILPGTAGKIEVLGHGQQFVAYGVHPSGAEFEWPAISLKDVARDALPAVTEDEIDQFLAAAGLIIGAEPPPCNPAPRVARSSAGATSELEELLSFVSATCSYDDWVKVLMAIHDETGGSGVGLSIADSWSSTGTSYPGSKKVEAKWQSFTADGGVGIGTIAHFAEQGGADLAAIAMRYGREGYQEVSPETLREWQEASDRIWQSFQRDAGVVERIEQRDVPEGFDPETGEEISTASTDQRDLDDAYLHPPGVVGEIADWICSWTAEPIRIHAVGAALVIVGTLLGRKVYSQVRPTSTALYIGAIAPSGMGKQHPQDAIRLALNEVTGGSSQYSGWAQSLPKLVMDLGSNASRVMVADEFADKLIGLRSHNASTSQSAISEGLRSLWGTNTGTYSPDASISRGGAEIMRPCFSFYGASTVKDFVRSLVSKDVTNGLFNRFLILPRFGRIDRRDDPIGVMVLPAGLKNRLQWLDQCLPPIDLSMAARGDGFPANPIMVPLSSGAAKLNEVNKMHQAEMMHASETDDALMLWGRFAEQCKRVAMVVACGRSPGDVSATVIDVQDLAWSSDLVRYSIEQFIGMVRRDMVENQVEGNRQKVLGVIRAAKVIKKFELLRRIRTIRAKELDEILVMLCQAECIGPVEFTGAGRTAKGYKFLHD